MPNHKTLFQSVCNHIKCDPRFEELRSGPGSEPARLMLDEVFQSFVDRDGNFVEQFQTTGFDARFLEIYLHAYFSRSGFTIDRIHSNPDFLVERNGVIAAVEATTVNASTGGVIGSHGSTIANLSEEERSEYTRNEFPIRLGSALFSKLKKQYWTLPHCVGLPLIFATEAFHDEGSLGFSDHALAAYLYGFRYSSTTWNDSGELVVETENVTHHEFGSKRIPSGLFFQPSAEHLSAVVFTNSGTKAKFSRMGYQSGYGCDSVNIRRWGQCYNPDPSVKDPTLFAYDMDDPPFVERWGQGLVVLHNPNALVPISDEFFADAIQGHFSEDEYVPLISSWHPFMSQTLVTHLGASKREIPRALFGYGPQGVASISSDVFHRLYPNCENRPGTFEDGWFTDQGGAFLGVVRREVDHDSWHFAVYALNEFAEFKLIDSKFGFTLRSIACQELQIKIMRLLREPQRVFPDLAKVHPQY